MKDISTLRAKLVRKPLDWPLWLDFAAWLSQREDPRPADLIRLEAELSAAREEPERWTALLDKVEALDAELRSPLHLDAYSPNADLMRLNRVLDAVRRRRDLAIGDTLDDVGRMPSMTCWLALDHLDTAALRSGDAPLTAGPSCQAHIQRIVNALIARINAAFDGVPVPDEDHLTIFQAQAADDYDTCDRSRDHVGRWQDLPISHIVDNESAWAYLDEQGIRYYLPAGALLDLRVDFRPGTVPGHAADSVALEHMHNTVQNADRTGLFDWHQCHAMWTFALLQSESAIPAAQKWEQAMAQRVEKRDARR